MALGNRAVQPLSRKRDSGGTSSEPERVRDVVPEHDSAVVPDRLPEPVDGGASEAQRVMHIALVVPDLAIYGELKRNAFAVAAHDVSGTVILHFILQRKDQSHEEIVQRWAATETGLVSPKVTGLQYPEEIQLGWEDERTAQERFDK